ncbi:hypothetical protein EXN66_Car015787 [Channa argus]|uniref:Uncharacterized protein n=1 Tax=Channa argus TaxID=215402 RepID=A0A6G1QBR4_CHAAH|nr:hypothetical protein EXN66_Car015787 [Channa argus]
MPFLPEPFLPEPFLPEPSRFFRAWVRWDSDLSASASQPNALPLGHQAPLFRPCTIASK